MRSVLPFHLAAQQFAVPLEHVIRVVPMLLPTQLPGAPANIAGVVSVHGDVLPVIDLAKCFNLSALTIELWTPMIWLRSSKRDLLLPVSALAEIMTVEPEKFVEASHSSINSSLLNGVLTQVDDLILILDIEALLSPSDETALQQALDEYFTIMAQQGDDNSPAATRGADT